MKQKKNNIYIFIFLAIFISLLALVVYLFVGNFNINIMSREIHNHNISFNEFDRSLKGIELISLINYTINHNNQMKEKESEDLVQIEVKITKDKIISMNTIIESGIEDFALYLGDQNFKMIEKEYHDNGKISLMRYELLSINSINNEEEQTSI